MKTAPFKTRVLTANRLSDGVSVWLGASGDWVLSIKDAFLARHDEAVTAIESAGAQALADNRVVDVNVIEVEETPAGPRPYRLRERIRAEGPSIDYAPVASARVSQAA
tara:strand:+ start:3396 stop:3719 length:324 start_codon:yes stop_codon:yes gene_type:complete